MVAILLLLLVGVYSLSIGDTIGWQSHSYNDLREWPQLLLKGAYSLKVDVYFISPTISTLLRYTKCSRKHGCFLLSHDTPLPTHTNINSSVELLSFLTQSHAFPESLTIALCFKNPPADKCGKSQESKQWHRLIDALFQDANKVRDSVSYKLEFILDGAATPHTPCLVGKWEPWVSTYIQNQDPQEVMRSTDSKYRGFQVLNDNEDYLHLGAKRKWGRFVNSSYPIQVWEPSDERGITRAAELYVGTGITHTPGFHFAINIDPVMFSIYSASISNVGMHSRVRENEHSPQILIVEDRIVLLSHSGNTQLLSIAEIAPSPVFVTLELPFEIKSPVLSSQSDLVMVSGSDKLLLYQFNNTQLLFKCQAGSFGYTKFTDIPLTLIHLNESMTLSHIEPESCGISSLASVSISIPVSEFAMDTTLLDDKLGVSIVYSQKSHLHKLILETSLDLLEMTVLSDRMYGVGTTPSISIANGIVAETHGGGYCLNTEGNNKSGIKSLCDRKPKSSSRVLGYSVGTWESWVAMEHASECSDGRMVHGVYDMGSHPSVFLDPASMWVYEVHEGVSGWSFSNCGSPIPHDGLVVDSWRIPFTTV